MKIVFPCCLTACGRWRCAPELTHKAGVLVRPGAYFRSPSTSMTVLFCTKRCFSESTPPECCPASRVGLAERTQRHRLGGKHEKVGVRLQRRSHESADDDVLAFKRQHLVGKTQSQPPPPLYSSSKLRRFSSSPAPSARKAQDKAARSAKFSYPLSVVQKVRIRSEASEFRRGFRILYVCAPEHRGSPPGALGILCVRGPPRPLRPRVENRSEFQERRPEHSERPVVAEGRHMPSLPIRHQRPRAMASAMMRKISVLFMKP